MDGDYTSNIPELSNLNEYRYENLFKVYNIDGYNVYNIISGLNFDKDIDKDYYYEWEVNRPIPWTIISYIHYETIELWWLICIFNEIQNPVKYPETGSVLKIFKPEYVRRIVDQIKEQTSE